MGNNGRKKNEGMGGTNTAGSITLDAAAAVKEPASIDEYWKWYEGNEELMNSVSGLAFSNYPGANLEFFTSPSSGYVASTTNYPGVAAIYVDNVLACSDLASPTKGTTSNAWQRAFNKMYIKLRLKRSGASDYEPSDVGLYCVCYGSIIDLFEHIKRGFGIAHFYSKYQRDIPDSLLVASGMTVTSSDISELSTLWNQLNLTIAKMNSFAIPKDLKYIHKGEWFFRKVYMDDPTKRAQLYIYVPATLYKFGLNSTTSAGEGVAVNVSTTNRSLSQWIALLNEFIDAFYNDPDAQKIHTDILSVYGEENCLKFESVPADYIVSPEYDEVVLNQIHNINVIDSTVSIPNITQDPTNTQLLAQAIGYTGITLGSVINGSSFRIFDSMYDEPSAKGIIIGNRLNNAFTKSGAGSSTTTSLTPCMEIVRQIAYFSYNSRTATRSQFTTSTYVSSTGANEAFRQTIYVFDQHPRLYINVSADGVNTISVNWELNNPATITTAQIKAIHEAAILNCLELPSSDSLSTGKF